MSDRKKAMSGAAVNAARKHPAEHLAEFKFQPGVSANPKGRPKGSRNKLGEDFLSALQADFAEHGPATIAKVREERPHEYLKFVASLLPKELNVKTSPLEGLSDEELEDSIQFLRRMARGDTAYVDPGTKH